MTLKIFHTGDLHLGMTFRNRSYAESVRKSLVEARFETLVELVEKANKERCQLFLVAGDLFHRTNVAEELVLKTMEILSRFTGNCVALLPGNHDYYDQYSILWKTLQEHSADNIVLLSRTAFYCLQDYNLDLTIYPAPCDSKHSKDNRLHWVRDVLQKPDTKWHLGVAHGSVKGVSPDFESQYFPMEREELASLGLHHWCLGHTHIRYPDFDIVHQSPFTYCGTPEPDGFDCNHGGFARITCLDDQGNVESRSFTTGQFRFKDVQGEIHNVGDLNNLLQGLNGDYEKTLLKLSLVGTITQDDFNCIEGSINKLQESLVYFEIDDSELAKLISPEVILAEFPYGSFPHLLLSSLEEQEENEALQMAYRLIKKVKK